MNRTHITKDESIRRIQRTYLLLVILFITSGAVGAQETQVTVCHIPSGNPEGATTLELHPAAARAHLRHGDVRGRCEDRPSQDCDGRGEANCETVAFSLNRFIELSAQEEEISALVEPERVGPPLGDITSKPPRTSMMAQCIEEAYESEPEVGFAYSIAQDGTVQASGAGGFARAPWETNAPGKKMSEFTRMHIASVSKPVTAVAVMKMVEDTEVSLDDPFFPLVADDFTGLFFTLEGQLLGLPGPGIENVTIRHLLTHTSGLTPKLGCLKLPLLLALGTIETPGTKHAYENTNFCLLRKVIEKVTGMNYITYVQNEVLTPAGVTQMSCDRDAVDPALYYNTIQDPGFPFPSYSQDCSAYGWYASAEDLAMFTGAMRFTSILSEASKTQMFNECFVRESWDYCLGWWKIEGAVGTYIQHMGDYYTGGCYNALTDTHECRRGVNSRIARFPLGIDASLIVNTREGKGPNPPLKNEWNILKDCYEEAFMDANDMLPAP